MTFLKSRKALLAEIARMERGRDEARAQVDVRNDEISALTASLIEKESEIEVQAARIFALETELAEAKSVADYAKTEVISIRSSTSWRLMKPLRKLGQLFGR